MSKLSKISKISKFPKLTKIPNHSCIIIFFSIFSCWPLMSQSLWYSGLRPAPLPPAQPLSLSTTGLNVLCVQNFNLFLKWGGEQMGTLGKNGAWGDAACTCPRTCVSRPCSSLCMVACVLALQVWCPPVQWCPVGRSPPCVSSIPVQWMITPIHLGRSNP